MLCKIADRIVEIPEAGGLAPRCQDYVYKGTEKADIIISEDLYPYDKHPEVSREVVAYMSSGAQFYKQLIELGGMMLHSSAVEYEGYVYLFSGASGMGKSTHASTWTRIFDGARIINDDKPALCCIDGVWFAYGTPWSGKTQININTKAPVAGICFLERGQENFIRRMTVKESIVNVIAQTTRKSLSEQKMNCLLNTIERLISDIPVYELSCLPDEAAARLSYETMRPRAKEI